MTATLTDEYIQMLKDDDQSRLDIFPQVNQIPNIDFNRVYTEVKDIHNSSVYFALGSFMYMYGYGGVEIDEAVGIYYLQKSARMGNLATISKVDFIYRKEDLYFESVKVLRKFMDKHIDLEENYERLVEKDKQLEEREKQLEERVKQLETENTELRYMPNGDGYM